MDTNCGNFGWHLCFLVFVSCGEVYEFISCALNYISDTMYYVLAIKEEKSHENNI